MTEPLLKADEVATILAVSRQRLYELVRTNMIPVVRLGRSYRFSGPALEEFIRKGGRALDGVLKHEVGA